MYLDICTVKDNLRGIIDPTKRKVIVPPEYISILYYEQGYVCENEQHKMDAYLKDGMQILSKANNLLFVNDSLILVSNEKKICLYNYVTRKNALNLLFDEILIFPGKEEMAVSYTANTSSYGLFETHNTLSFHLENLICVRKDDYWGIIKLEDGTIKANFDFLDAAQFTKHRIALKDKNGDNFIFKC